MKCLRPEGGPEGPPFCIFCGWLVTEAADWNYINSIRTPIRIIAYTNENHSECRSFHFGRVYFCVSAVRVFTPSSIRVSHCICKDTEVADAQCLE